MDKRRKLKGKSLVRINLEVSTEIRMALKLCAIDEERTVLDIIYKFIMVYLFDKRSCIQGFDEALWKQVEKEVELSLGFIEKID